MDKRQSNEISRKGRETLLFEAYKSKGRVWAWIFRASVVLSLGAFGIIAKIYPKFYCNFFREKTEFESCTHILVCREGKHFEEVQVMDISGGDFRIIEYRKEKFIYNQITQKFSFQPAKLKDQDLLPWRLSQLITKGGLSMFEARQKLSINGPNTITIDNVPVLVMLLDKITQIFYLFQIASVIIWLVEGYSTYAWLILFMSSASIIWEIYNAKMNEKQLRSLTELDAEFFVLRENQVFKVPAIELVAGDIVVLHPDTLEPNTKLPCDVVVMQGECLMDESSLTGETVPVLKLPLQIPDISFQEPLDIERNRTNVLFGGSTILQLRPENRNFKPPSREASQEFLDVDIKKSRQIKSVRFNLETRPSYHGSIMAIVLSTGFSTSKGDLFKSILFPTEVELKLNRDALSFLMILGFVAFLAFINKMVNGILDGNDLLYTLVISLDLITIAVPPALPLILTVGISFSIQRLKKLSIFCIDSERLHYAGRLDTMCWDKTGTITVPALLFAGVHHPEEDDELSHSALDFSPAKVMSQPEAIERFMVICHGLTRPENDYLGHSLDIETFKMTDWSIEKQNPTVQEKQTLPAVLRICMGGSSIHIVKRFEFDAHLQRSSVIAVSSLLPAYIYVKGSPESIKCLCKANSIPDNFDAMCSRYSSMGYYVIALACKRIDSTYLTQLDQLSRNQIENELDFKGFLLFENPIKKQAYPTFSALKEANISSVIITGDNALTAVHVARQLKLTSTVYLVDKDDIGLFYLVLESVSGSPLYAEPRRFSASDLVFSIHDSGAHVAMTGAALIEMQKNDKVLLDTLMPITIIFSRAKPDQKTWIIEWLIKNGKQVGMCGDGTNDCGALKAAHVGLALSSAEASIVAPFTSAEKRISDIVLLVKEGRCSLETSFVGFKYMTLYPLIQLMISATLNQMGVSLSSNQYLFDDMILVTALALFALYTQPIDHLKRSKPVDTLFSPEILVSLIGQLSLCIFWFAMNVYITTRSDGTWYCKVSTAISKLNSSYLPLNGNLNDQDNYPCFAIDPNYDSSLSFLIKSHENTSLWTFGHFQFIIVIVAISVVSQYRKPFWTNQWFSLYAFFVFMIISWQLLYLTNSGASKLPGPLEYDSTLSSWFNIAPGIPFSFRLLQLFFIVFHLFCSIVLELSWNWYRHEKSKTTRSSELLPLL